MAVKPDVVQVLPIIEELEKFINDAEYYPSRNSYRGMVVLGLVSKALTVGRAVCSLVSSGFPGEAFGLSRTLIDICFTVRYISNNDTEERAKKFAEFYSKDHEGWTKIVTKFYPATTIVDSEFHKDALEMARSYKNAHQWTGMGDQTRQMAIEPDTYEFDASVRELTVNTTMKSFTNGLHFLSMQPCRASKVISRSGASLFESMPEVGWK